MLGVQIFMTFDDSVCRLSFIVEIETVLFPLQK